MFDSIGFQELILIGLVALLVVGPKELPLLMRKGGQWMNKMRGMAADFRATFDEMARQAELDELRKEVESLRDNNPIQDIQNQLSQPLDLGLEADDGEVDVGDYQDTSCADVNPEPELAPRAGRAKSIASDDISSPTDGASAKRKSKSKSKSKSKAKAKAKATPKTKAPRKPSAKAAAKSSAVPDIVSAGLEEAPQ